MFLFLKKGFSVIKFRLILNLKLMKKNILLFGFCIICWNLYSQQSGESLNSESLIGTTNYDLQTNKSCQNRIYLYPDGTIGGTWMMSQTTTFDDRGTGYNYYNGTSWGSFPVSRIETIKSGWPSYAPYGASGEIVVSHKIGFPLNICKRATKGSGNWVIGDIPLPSGVTCMQWPRMVTNGPNHNYIHVIANTAPQSNGGTPYQGLDGAILYNRSLNGGTSWSGWQLLSGMTSSQYLGFSADTYEWANPKGDTLCFVVGDNWNDLFIMKSCDNGTSWTKTMVWHCPYNLWNGGSQVSPFYCCDGSNAVALDNSGKAHVVFGRQKAYGDYNGYRYLVPYTDGLIYWNENQTQLIQTLDSATLVAGGHFIGYVQDPAVWSAGPAALAYYSLSLSSMPTMTIDQYNHIYVVWSGVTNHRDPDNFMLRHLFARASVCNGMSWCPTIVELTGGTNYNSLECVYPGLSPTSSTDYLYFLYQSDNLAGAYVKGLNGAQGQTTITSNDIRCMTVPKNTIHCGAAPQVDFTASNLNPTMNQTVNFTDLSANCPTSWQWSFSPSSVQYMNGTSSASQNPSVQFTAVGVYSLTLTASNIFGTGTLTKTNYITVSPPPPPLADFSANPTTLNIGNSAQFTDLSANSPTSWSWTFEGGIPSTSTVHSPPPIRYDSAGQYTVSLTVSNAYGSDTVTKLNYITVVIPVLPSADFSGTPTALYTGEQVQFSDMSTGDPNTWLWIFEGGTPSSSSLKTPPAITYSTAGEYDVTLTVFNPNGNSTKNKVKYITVVNSDEPIARFSGTPTTLDVGNQVQFIDESRGSPTTWVWTFEGGIPGSCNGQSPPPVTYTVAGSYDVSLQVTNQFGTHTSTIQDYITVTNPFTPVAEFSCDDRNIIKGDSVLFIDESTGYPSSYSWTFENGTPAASSEKSPPRIVYSNSGNFNVTLTVTNPNGSSTMSKNDYILVGGNGIDKEESGQLSVYPNPVVDKVFFKAEWIISEISIWDIYGKCLIRTPVNMKSGSIDLSSLVSGMYILSVNKDKNQINRKIVIR
jgi:PKD repeat protein